MSLLLDALKSTDSGSAQATELESMEPKPMEPDEEPLDAHATLRLLAPRAAPGGLALEPMSGNTTNSTAAAPKLAADAAPAAPPVLAPIIERLADRTAERAAVQAAVAAPATAQATVAAPSAAPRTKRYGLLIVMLAALAAIGTLGKSLWWPGTNAIVYPEGGEVQQSPATPVQPPTPSTAAVQVSSARPPAQFGYSGDAPEIDLRDTGRGVAAPPANARPAADAKASISVTRRASTTTNPAVAAMSVTRSEGPSAIDRHVQGGYQALAAGNLTGAGNEYLAALELDPHNIDALLGAATTAARDGRAAAADAAYAQVLKLEPGNPDATAAKAMLAAHGSAGEANESRLKILIAGGDGGRPALHAALAGVYAADLRWSDAAQEYFAALGKDPGNPDLAFNVAASLDQNRNPVMALNYYRQAMAFARQRATQLDLHALERRITQLQARVDAPAPIASETP